MSSSEDDLPQDIENAATGVIENLVPQKSRERYHLTYNKYEKWCKEKKILNITNEKALLVYFDELSKLQKPTSLWCYYSMLRTELLIKQNIDIKKHINLIALLKRKSEGYKPKKSKVFSKEEITKFIVNAGDEKFLCMKVVLIIGLAGACRKEELTNLLIENVKYQGLCYQIVIPNTKTKISREFFVTSGNIDGVNLVTIVRKYSTLRSKTCGHQRFFVGYRAGKCTTQPIGINTIGSVPRLIAEFLELPNPKQYTGHCLRRSSTSILADSGADLLNIKRHGGWKSNSVAEGYIETSVENKKKTAMKILRENQENIPSTSKHTETNICNYQASGISASGINLYDYKDCTINIFNK